MINVFFPVEDHEVLWRHPFKDSADAGLEIVEEERLGSAGEVFGEDLDDFSCCEICSVDVRAVDHYWDALPKRMLGDEVPYVVY